ncbi:MAG: Dyp-type peroxidase [Hahellaceae bacterium]|nr:Dyp-type peroxidase [Hahellaceae bacterium]MCP5168899.1 Dyp-type peroxidase [Hahellaceae bacterium]
MTQCFQQGILADIPAHGRYLFFSLKQSCQAAKALSLLAEAADGDHCVVGLGALLTDALDVDLPGLANFPSLAANGVAVPSTPFALMCWLRGDSRGALIAEMHSLEALLAPAFRLEVAVDAFRHGSGRDLTGYEDGTENPTADAAIDAAFVSDSIAGLQSGSFVAIQQWLHEFSQFNAMTPSQQDDSIGRRKADNEELEDAPESAHVKRTAQESFDPEAFLLRRSMPWSDGRNSGLMFVAFASSFEPFEAQLARMCGMEDGIVDALFQFTRPISGAYFWCPPMNEQGCLDLRALGL